MDSKVGHILLKQLQNHITDKPPPPHTQLWCGWEGYYEFGSLGGPTPCVCVTTCL